VATGQPVAETDIDDELLVAAAQQGCTEAFATLYLRHHDEVFHFLLRRTNDGHLAQDLTSETFLRAWQRIHGFVGGHFVSWLVRIARNLLVDHVRLARVRHEFSVDEVRELEPAHLGHSAVGDPAGLLLEREELLEKGRLVQDLLAQLTPDQRACLELRFLHERDLAQAAVALDRSVGAVKLLQHRALAAMQRSLPSR